MSSVVFSYSQIPEKKRLAQHTDSTQRLTELPYEFHVDIKTLPKPGTSEKPNRDGASSMAYIYDFLQNCCDSNKNNLTSIITDTDLGLFYNTQAKFKQAYLSVDDSGNLVKRPIDILAALLRESGAKGVEIYQRSPIGVFANIINAVVYKQYPKYIDHLFKARHPMDSIDYVFKIPDHYVTEYPYTPNIT